MKAVTRLHLRASTHDVEQHVHPALREQWIPSSEVGEGDSGEADDLSRPVLIQILVRSVFAFSRTETSALLFPDSPGKPVPQTADVSVAA